MDHASNTLFAVLVVIFVIGTYALALSLENIISQWSRFKKQRWRRNNRNLNQNIEEKEVEDDDEHDVGFVSMQQNSERQPSRYSFDMLRRWIGPKREEQPGRGKGDSDEKISGAVQASVV